MRFAFYLLLTMALFMFVAAPLLVCSIGYVNGTLAQVTDGAMLAICAASLVACTPFAWAANRLAKVEM